MKKFTSTIAVAVLILSMFLPQYTMAQSPQKMSYQSVVRNDTGNLVMESPVGIQISILQGSPVGTAAYVETHSVTTNVNGLASLEIGMGTMNTGTFADIDWGNGPYFIKTEIDPSGGFSYSMSATTELLSVPYALYAGDDGDWTQDADKMSTDKLVGIGVVDPQARLDVIGGDWNLDAGNPGDLRIGNETNNFRIGIATGGGGAGITRLYTNSNALILGANNTPSLIFEMDGSITAPSVSDSLIDNAGNKALITKEYGVTNFSSTGLEAIDEGNGLGWRLIGRDSAIYDDIGFNAVDFSTRVIEIDSSGAFGNNSMAMGFSTNARGSYSTAMGSNSLASGFVSTAMGNNTDATGSYSTAMGIVSYASGTASTAMGSNTNAPSYVETAIGSFNTQYTPNSSTFWDASDRLFVVGNGTTSGNRSDAFTIQKSGTTTINSNSTGLRIFAPSNGIQIHNPGSNGVAVFSAFNNGVIVYSAGENGVQVTSADSNGVHVTSADNNGVHVNSADNNGGFFNGVAAGVHAVSSGDANPDLILGGTSNTAAGDNGIIASDPDYAGSDILLRSNDAVAITIDFDNDEDGEFEIFNGAGTEVFEVKESGDVRVNGSLIHASDKRLKKDIEDLPYGLKEILLLQPKAYNWKDRTQEHKSLGLIAQDVQPHIKEIVTVKDDAEKTLGISYTALIPVLIKAIQEQQEKINELKEENIAQAEALNSNTTLMEDLQSIINQQSQK